MENSLKSSALQSIRPALVLFIILSIITGIAYPLLTTGIGQWLLPAQANGSLIMQGDKVIGSSLIGQNFTQAQYFWAVHQPQRHILTMRLLHLAQILGR